MHGSAEGMPDVPRGDTKHPPRDVTLAVGSLAPQRLREPQHYAG